MRLLVVSKAVLSFLIVVVVGIVLSSILGCATGWNRKMMKSASPNAPSAIICSKMPLNIYRIDGERTRGAYMVHSKCRFVVSPGKHVVQVKYGHSDTISDFINIGVELGPNDRIEFQAEQESVWSGKWAPVAFTGPTACQ